MKYILHKKKSDGTESIIAEGTDEELVLRKVIPAIVSDLQKCTGVVDYLKPFEIECVYMNEPYIKESLRRKGRRHYSSCMDIYYWLTTEGDNKWERNKKR